MKLITDKIENDGVDDFHDSNLFKKSIDRIASSGYGPGLINAHRGVLTKIVKKFGSSELSSFTSTVSLVAIKASRSDATQFCRSVEIITDEISEYRDLINLQKLVLQIISDSPKVLNIIIERAPSLVSHFGIKEWLFWVEAGIKFSPHDYSKKESYYNLKHPESRQILYQQTGNVTFQQLSRELKLKVRALFGLSPVFREFHDDKRNIVKHRSSFSGDLYLLPSAYANVVGIEKQTYEAAIFHLAAHSKFGGERFEVGQLKPMQTGIISLIEDARVEWLSIAQMPGLHSIWQKFHMSVEPVGVATATSLFSRLSRALIDPSFTCDDAWVQKGRNMFFKAKENWHDPRISRAIGNLLGNDLGQLRVQFNAKDYVVQPTYRDDNLGLWNFDQDEVQLNEQTELMIETSELRRRKSEPENNQKSDDVKDDTDESKIGKIKTVNSEEDKGVLITRLPEYDYDSNILRDNWVKIYEYKPHSGSLNYWQKLEESYSGLIHRTETLVNAMALGKQIRLKKQSEGEKLDIDASIEASISFRSGAIPDTNIYEGTSPPERSIAIHLLLDTSQSTSEKIGNDGASILDIERNAAAILAKALDKLGDPFAITGFCSVGKDDVRLQPIKKFEEGLSVLTGMNLSGLKSNFSTRIGSIIRYSGTSFTKVKAMRKLVLVITDGEPSDVDVTDSEYLIQDARHAINGLKKIQVDAFCVALGERAGERSREIFGTARSVTISDIENLPDKLARIYLRMTS